MPNESKTECIVFNESTRIYQVLNYVQWYGIKLFWAKKLYCFEVLQKEGKIHSVIFSKLIRLKIPRNNSS